MSREQLRQKALRLRKRGRTFKQIAAEVGVSTATVQRWCKPDYAERQRAVARAWKDRNRKQQSAYNATYRADPTTRAECPRCGRPTGASKGQRSRPLPAWCRECKQDELAERDQELARLWAKGAKHPEIAAHFGWSPGHLQVEMFRARARGANLPYRYSMQDGKRVAA